MVQVLELIKSVLTALLLGNLIAIAAVFACCINDAIRKADREERYIMGTDNKRLHILAHRFSSRKKQPKDVEKVRADHCSHCQWLKDGEPVCILPRCLRGLRIYQREGDSISELQNCGDGRSSDVQTEN